MSVLGIAGNSLLNYLTQGLQPSGTGQQFQKEFQQLGQDLQAGNPSAAQSDFASLEKNNLPQLSASGFSTPSNNSLSPEFNQLAEDLQSGNFSQAQQAYTSIQQDFQSNVAPSQGWHSHARHNHTGTGGDSQSQSGAISQLFNALGSALQTGNLSNAQQIYSSLQQDLTSLTQGGGAAATVASASGLSVNG